MTRVPYDGKEDARGLRLVGHTDLDGHGDCMHIARKGQYAYVGHMGDSRAGTSIVDVSDPSRPRLVNQMPAREGVYSHKVQIVGDIMLVNHERFDWPPSQTWAGGLSVHDISNPVEPRQLAFFPVAGRGVHRMTFWDLPYAYVTASDVGFDEKFLRVLDLSSPRNPTEVGRWWFPGQWRAGGETPAWEPGRRAVLRHAIIAGDRAYCGWWDMGLVILDISDRTRPRLVSHLDFGACVSASTHTTCPVPGANLLVVTDECIVPDCREPFRKQVRIVDIQEETNPRVISLLPVPEGDFCSRGGRFGPHNLHEMEPGSQIDPSTVYLTYFNAGLRIYDISDPTNPREIAYYIPETPPGQKAPQTNGVLAGADGLIYITDRHNGGLYILERV